MNGNDAQIASAVDDSGSEYAGQETSAAQNANETSLNIASSSKVFDVGVTQQGQPATLPDAHDDGDDGYDTAETGNEDYEDIRQRQIQENQRLLSSLGINPIITSLRGESSSSFLRSPSQQSPLRRKRKETALQPKYDRSGYIVSLPNSGERQIMAAVEIPSDRKLMRSIADGEYQDCSWWSEGEAHRKRFGWGESSVQMGEKAVVGGVGPDFRWRKWRGLARELRSELNKRKEVDKHDREEPQPGADVSLYSLLPGDACHQCRRKSEKPKMKCRNVDPMCRATFCETCCKRYSYFDFDSESRSFICPLCKNCCNCSNCIRKRNLAHLLAPTKSGRRIQSLNARLRQEGVQGMTVEAWLSQAVQDRVGVPFDRVRIVDQATDIISPEIPTAPPPVDDEMIEVAPRRCRKKQKPMLDGESKPKKTKKRKGGTGPAGETQRPIKLKFNLPKPSEMHNGVGEHQSTELPPKQKEVDSDGDTVGGYSSDEQGQGRPGPKSHESTLTPLSRSTSPTSQPVLSLSPEAQLHFDPHSMPPGVLHAATLVSSTLHLPPPPAEDSSALDSVRVQHDLSPRVKAFSTEPTRWVAQDYPSSEPNQRVQAYEAGQQDTQHQYHHGDELIEPPTPLPIISNPTHGDHREPTLPYPFATDYNYVYDRTIPDSGQSGTHPAYQVLPVPHPYNTPETRYSTVEYNYETSAYRSHHLPTRGPYSSQMTDCNSYTNPLVFQPPTLRRYDYYDPSINEHENDSHDHGDNLQLAIQ